MGQSPQGWTVVDTNPQGWTPVEPTQPKPAVDDGAWAQSFGRAALGSLAGSVSPDVLDTVGNGVIGILKGAGHTAETLGKLVHKIPGVSSAVDAVAGTPGLSSNAFAEADKALTPTNTAQRVGYSAEQGAEFLVPAGAAEKGAATIARAVPRFTNAPRLIRVAAKAAPRMATEAAAAGGVSAAQGADPTAPAIVAGVTHGASALAGEAVPALRAAAEKQVQQFQGPTKERFKAMAERLTPGILQRGLRGSREAVLAQATDAAEQAGQNIDTAIQQFGTRQVGVQPIVDALEKAKDAFRTVRPGNGLVVELEPRALRQLDSLQGIVKDLGPDASVEQLIGVRRAWDKVVDQAGGFSHRGPGGIGMPLKDTTEAAAKLEATTAIRKLLDQKVPELSALNKEFSFWKGLQDVLTQTTQRVQPQKAGVGQLMAEATGQVVGGTVGSGGGPGAAVGSAFALGKVAKMAQAVFSSPRWQLASAQTKDALAQAIQNNRVSDITAILGRLSAGATAQAER